jgi:hypothetical protein
MIKQILCVLFGHPATDQWSICKRCHRKAAY